MKSTLAAIAAGLALGLTGAANASILSFNYTPSTGSTFASRTVVVDGVTITYSAANFTSTSYNSSTNTGTATIAMGGNTGEALLQQNGGYGLALRNSPDDDQHYIDGSGWQDLVVIEFSKVVNLTTVLFNFADRYDDFALFVGDSVDTLSEYSLGDISDLASDCCGGSDSRATVPFDVLGKVFAIGAPGSNDNFKLKKVYFSEWEETPGDPVPLPAGLPLMATALAGGAFFRSRKKKAAAK